MFRIGKVEIEKYPLLLAPMEDVSDSVFRFFCKKFGADLMYTEFISSDGLIRGGKKGLDKLNIVDEERPIGIQIYGHLANAMVEASKIVERANPEIIDINFGCPVKKIARRGAGSGMMRDPDTLVEITKQIVKSTNFPVTVKTRLGWDDKSKIIVELAERLQDVGIQALTIHGRTGKQMYTGEADWTLIGEVKNNPRMKIPIIGNGDITSPEIAKEKIDRYGVDALMVGRATIGRPWIFEEINHYLETDEIKEFTLLEKIDFVKQHFARSIETKEARRGILSMRRHFANYFRNLPHFRDIKIRLLTSLEVDEIYGILDEISLKYSE